MTRRGPAPKPAGTRQGHRSRSEKDGAATLAVVAPIRVDVPKPPSGLLKATREDWAAYWHSDPAALALPVDMPTIERRFALLDEWRRCRNAYVKQRVVRGSQGQPVINPLAKQASIIEKELRALDAELGLSPLARARLRITPQPANGSLSDLEDAADHDPDADEDDDPRAAMELAASDE